MHFLVFETQTHTEKLTGFSRSKPTGMLQKLARTCGQNIQTITTGARFNFRHTARFFLFQFANFSGVFLIPTFER